MAVAVSVAGPSRVQRRLVSTPATPPVPLALPLASFLQVESKTLPTYNSITPQADKHSSHAVHNCCVNDGGWTYNDRAKSLTKTVCDGYSSASMYNGACAEAAGSGSISGDAFYDACRALAPNDESVGAGYRGSC